MAPRPLLTMIKIRRLPLLTPVLAFALGYFTHYVFHKPAQMSFNSVPSMTKGSNQFLVILVLSSIDNHERRDAIRDTWASNLDPDVKLYFVLSGKGLSSEKLNTLQDEHDQHSDLLILHGVEDMFQTLTQKVLLSFTWLTGDNGRLGTLGNASIVKPFQTFSYVIKCDDDSYVRVNPILDELKSTYDFDMLYWGFFDGRAKVKKIGKYKEMSWNICDSYLPYALGGGYVLASKPVSFIAKNAEYWRRYNSEDTSVGAWLANLEGVHKVHDPRFDTEYLSRGCHQSYLVTHKHAAIDIRKIHEHLSKTGHLCPKEYRTRLSYRYDWTVIPSKCCLRNNPNIP